MNQPQPTQPKSSLVRPWLLIVFIIVLLGGGGYFGWYFWSQSKAPAATSTTTPTTATTTPTNTTATADWQTYKNETYGFTIKYPKNLSYDLSNDGKFIAFLTSEAKLKFEECAKNIETECVKSAEINISIDQDSVEPSKTLDEIVQNRITQMLLTNDAKKITLAGQPAYEGAALGMLENYMILSKYNNHIYELSNTICRLDTPSLTGCKAELTETQKQMLSTFQFTK